jgi:hypothetical protein
MSSKFNDQPINEIRFTGIDKNGSEQTGAEVVRIMSGTSNKCIWCKSGVYHIYIDNTNESDSSSATYEVYRKSSPTAKAASEYLSDGDYIYGDDVINVSIERGSSTFEWYFTVVDELYIDIPQLSDTHTITLTPTGLIESLEIFRVSTHSDDEEEQLFNGTVTSGETYYLYAYYGDVLSGRWTDSDGTHTIDEFTVTGNKVLPIRGAVPEYTLSIVTNAYSEAKVTRTSSPLKGAELCELFDGDVIYKGDKIKIEGFTEENCGLHSYVVNNTSTGVTSGAVTYPVEKDMEIKITGYRFKQFTITVDYGAYVNSCRYKIGTGSWVYPTLAENGYGLSWKETSFYYDDTKYNLTVEMYDYETSKNSIIHDIVYSPKMNYSKNYSNGTHGTFNSSTCLIPAGSDITRLFLYQTYSNTLKSGYTKCNLSTTSWYESTGTLINGTQSFISGLYRNTSTNTWAMEVKDPHFNLILDEETGYGGEYLYRIGLATDTNLSLKTIGYSEPTIIYSNGNEIPLFAYNSKEISIVDSNEFCILQLVAYANDEEGYSYGGRIQGFKLIKKSSTYYLQRITGRS